jgi:hyperosmotically inducible periplasmic protein
MKLSMFAIVALLAAGPTAATAAAQATAVSGTDQVLGSRIAKRINGDPTLKKYDIKVSVDAGVARLSGTVATEGDRTKAAQLAKVPGVTRVDNDIVADLDAATKPKGTAGKAVEKTKEGTEKAVEKTKEGTEKAIEKTKEGGEKIADKTKEGLSKTGEVITDSWITTRVKAKFTGEDALKDGDIHVTTDNHVVTLTGTVPNAAARARAVEEAREVEGVHRVVDKLTIGVKK